jgi:hypothetical protein
MRWCVGRVVLEQSLADGLPLATEDVARHRILSLRVILATRQVGGAYGGIVELLALTGQWRETSGKPAAKVVRDGM